VNTADECSALCAKKEGCNYFVIGVDSAKGHCYWEYDTACKKGKFDKADYDAYQRIKKEAVTPKYGGNGGGVVIDRCADGAYIKQWKLRTGALVDQIVAVCSDGKTLKKCGGNGGGPSTVTAAASTSVRTGALVDNFAGKGGNGGHAHKLTCPDGYQPTGVRFRCGALVDAVRLECTEK
jgi:hypothetical protein